MNIENPTFARAFNFSELGEFSFLEFQTKATCTLPEITEKFIVIFKDLNRPFLTNHKSKYSHYRKQWDSEISATNHFDIFVRQEEMCHT